MYKDNNLEIDNMEINNTEANNVETNNTDINNTKIYYAMNGHKLHPEDIVTTEQFVTMIIRASKGDIEPVSDHWSSGYMSYALHKGIIEDYDIMNSSNPIERRKVARIVHEVLLTELGEKDEDEWSEANKLKDLYMCRTCVIHIAQVYVKGIILLRDNNMFDVKGSTNFAEAKSIIARVLDRGQRIPQTGDRENVIKTIILSPDEAWSLRLNDNKALLIDVRTTEEYETGHIDGSSCIPLRDITNNPFSVCEDRDNPIILYCYKGYKSALAAQMLIDAGYSRIYTIPGIDQYNYKR